MVKKKENNFLRDDSAKDPHYSLIGFFAEVLVGESVRMVMIPSVSPWIIRIPNITFLVDMPIPQDLQAVY